VTKTAGKMTSPSPPCSILFGKETFGGLFWSDIFLFFRRLRSPARTRLALGDHKIPCAAEVIARHGLPL
jgi:hypothetical protein